MTLIALDAARTMTLDAATRQVAGLAVPYGATGRTLLGQIRFSDGSISWPADLSHVKLLMSHDPDRPVGIATSLHSDADGLHATFTIPAGAPGDAALAEAQTGLRDGLSVGIDLDDASYQRLWGEMFSDDPQPVDCSGQLREISLCSIPAFDDARVASVAAARQGRPIMTEAPPAPATMVAAAPPPSPEPSTPPAPLPLAPVPHAGRAGGTRRDGADLTLMRMAQLVSAVNRRELEADILTAALADITSDNWVTPPAYVSQLAGLITVGRPLVDAFGTSNLPATGQDYHYPKVGSKPNPDVVTAEKTQIPTGPVTITDVSVPVKTIAWGNDVSIQTMDRSDPAFLALYWELCAEYYARRCDLLSWAAITAAKAPVAGDDAGDLLLATIEAAEAGGRPVDVVVAGLGYRRSVVGGSSAMTLPIAVSDVLGQIVEDPNLPVGSVVAGNRSAFTWAENPAAPARLQAVNVSLLGYDLGVYGYAAYEVRYPESLATGTYTPPAAPPLTRSSAKA